MVLKTATLGFLTVGLVVGDDSGGQSTVGTDRVLGAGSHTEVSQWDWKWGSYGGCPPPPSPLALAAATWTHLEVTL